MNYGEGKERGSSLSTNTYTEENGREHQRHPACFQGHRRSLEGHWDSRPQADNLVINGRKLERPLETIFRDPRSVQEFVQKEIIHNKQNGASLSESSSFHSMNMELIRLGSFHNFPASRTVSTLKLARNGFYYSGKGDMVICFACGCQKQNWRSGDIINIVHRTLSPNCPLLTSLPTTNVQIGDSLGNGHSKSLFKNSEEQQSKTTRTGCLASNEQPTSANNATRKESTEDETGNTSPIARKQQTLDNKRNGETHNPTSKPSPIDHLTRARLQQEKINAFLQGLDPLGINFDRPKYPSYAVVTVRVSSFSHWPSTLTQTPRALAMAGFFYAGYGDYTRCFFCGGGLRNWEPGDDPWTEHARWFPKCAFTRQNKGDQFVALVQVRHQELEALEASNGHTDEQTNGLDQTSEENSSQHDVTSLPAFQSVQEMGYQAEIIHQAFDVLKRSKDLIHIKAENLLEVILDQEENAGKDIPPSSSSGRTQEVKQVKVAATMSNKDTNNSQGQLSETSVQPKASESPTAVADNTQSLLEENRQLKDLRMCKICMENEASVAMLPCGHLCCCTDCAPAMRKCPICRQFVKGTVRTWLA